jgi:L-ornithine N5-monooxygenase
VQRARDWQNQVSGGRFALRWRARSGAFWPGTAEELHVNEGLIDLVGVGFGPANLALAISLEDEHSPLIGSGWRYRFFERQETATWHPGMLLPETTLQTSFLKDLVTLRNPCSRFSFLNYLHVHGRLHKFVNLRTFYPTRIEYEDYLRWAAGQLRHRVEYGATVRAIRPGPSDPDGTIPTLRVEVEGACSGLREQLAHAVVLGVGRAPELPPGIDLRSGTRVFHSADFLTRICCEFGDTDRRYSFAVVGSGQSAAEIFQFLLVRYRRSDVTAILRQWAYKQADSSEFINELYEPATTDFVYGTRTASKTLLIDRYRDTNYSVVDGPLISTIYRTIYELELQEERRARFVRLHDVEGCREHADGAELLLRDLTTDARSHLCVDAVVFATGYTDGPARGLLDGVSDLLRRDDLGGYVIGRDYRLDTDPRLRARIFVQGMAERTHGLSDSVLSILAVRAGEIGSAIAEPERARVPAGHLPGGEKRL